MTVAVLFALRESVYKTLSDVEVYDIDRDARTYDGPWPVVAHPPCRSWGRLRHMATRTRPDERNLARLAVALVREFGGVLEHPVHSTLWKSQMMPIPGGCDQWGGWTMAAPQKWWGHRAEKMTWFYIVGCQPHNVPDIPLTLAQAPCVVNTRSRSPRRLPEISKREREMSPLDLAEWLVSLASRCTGVYTPPSGEKV